MDSQLSCQKAGNLTVATGIHFWKNAAEQCFNVSQPSENVRLAFIRKLACGQSPPYDPDIVDDFCQEDGAPTIFGELVKMMTATRLDRACTDKHKKQARCQAVVTLYTMCYSQSKLCNWLQKDMAVYLHSHGLSDMGLVGVHTMGLTISKQTLHSFVCNARATHQQHINSVIKEAIEKQRRISLMVDDYTNVHTFRRPTSEQSVEVAHMATVLIRIFDEPAIRAGGHEIGPANDPAGIDIQTLKTQFETNITTVLKPFVITAPVQIREQFFTPQRERERLTTHMYGEANHIRQRRGVANSYLIDCVPQPLKSVQNFRQAANVYLNTPLAQYLEKYVILTPGDWPAQFYHRQIAHNEQFEPACLRNIVPSIGPLHISLNSQEHVVRKHISFFKKMQHALFGKELANKPRPWRVTLLLELAYGGWTLIREPVLNRLSKFKDVQFLTLLHLLDNNIPVSLSIYSVLFKSNDFPAYKRAMMQLWVIVWIYKRRHYDKALLVWLSQRIYWENINHPLLQATTTHMHEEDEYPIEHFHGQIRGETNEYDYAQTIRNKAIWIDNNKQQLHNFSLWFLPPPRAHFSHNQLRGLKIKAGKFLLRLINDICTHPFSAEEQPRQRKNLTRWVLLHLLGPTVVKNVLLPLGYQFVAHRKLVQQFGPHQALQPSQQEACDLHACIAPAGQDPVLLFRCGHSFHRQCLVHTERSNQHCFICSAGVVAEVRAKATVARAAIFNPNANPGQHNDDSESDDEEDDGGNDDNNADLGAHYAPDITQQEAQVQINLLAQHVATLPAVPLV